MLLIVIIFGLYVHRIIYVPINKDDPNPVSVIIKQGDSVKNIAKNLKDKDIIRSETAFYTYLRLVDKGEKNIIAGRHILNKTMTFPDVIKAIQTISKSETVLTVQEGLTVEDIDKKLVDIGLISTGDFNKAVKNFDDYDSYWFLNKDISSELDYPLEGYLYPDTYFLDSVSFSSESLVYKMLNNFEKKFQPLKTDFEKQERSMHDIITMSSILQREVRTQKDYPIVSGLLWKRFDSNWHIGADATILYATKKKTIEPQDLKVDSPYNTRLYVGMPPGPICNPDIEHIEGTLNPVESEYWYYLTTLDTGEVIYAKTNEEHNINKQKYLRR